MVDASLYNAYPPNIQTSLAVVNRRKLIDSGAIHLMGSLPLEAEVKRSSSVTDSDPKSLVLRLVNR